MSLWKTCIGTTSETSFLSMWRSLTLTNERCSERTDKVYVGVDPGKKGAIAIIAGDLVMIEDMPTPEKALELIRKSQPWGCRVAIEHVHPLPGQSCIASFTYGEQFLLAFLIGLWYSSNPVLVSPQRWKKFYGLKKEPDETKTEYKRKSVMKARELFPQAEDLLKISKDGRAEALLIANWLRESDKDE